MTDPFIISVPEGETEIDLTPILRPLVRKLMLSFKKGCAFNDASVDAWITKVYRDDHRVKLVNRLRTEWISRYMLDHDWVGGSNHSPSSQYYPNKGEYDRWKPYVCVVMKERYVEDDEDLADMHARAVKGIAKYEDRSFEEVAEAILAHTSAIDALGAVADG